MTNEERDIIARFITRVAGGGSGFGSGTGAPALPPVDMDADRFIAEQFAHHPEARYRITQTAFVQEAALTEAQSRIQRLQWELQQAQQAQQARPQNRGLFGGLFGGGGGGAQPQQSYQQAPPPPPPPQYAPGMAQPGMFQQGGSGFLGSALTTAAGVAGGMVAGNLLMDMFSSHHGGMGGGFGGGFGGGGMPQESITNNYYGGAGDAAGGGGAPAGGDPWGGAAGVAPDQADGFWSKDDAYSQSPPPDAPSWSDGGDLGGASDVGGDDGWT